MGEYRKPGMDRVLGAIADPTRRAILARLAESEARVTELASAFPISLNSVSKHVRKLEAAGLLRRDVRGRDHVLSLNAAPLSEAADWIAHYQRFWADGLAALDEFATRKKTPQRKRK
jgi:DNA-binding transcriptional ArsR family regulator